MVSLEKVEFFHRVDGACQTGSLMINKISLQPRGDVTYEVQSFTV